MHLGRSFQNVSRDSEKWKLTTLSLEDYTEGIIFHPHLLLEHAYWTFCLLETSWWFSFQQQTATDLTSSLHGGYYFLQLLNFTALHSCIALKLIDANPFLWSMNKITPARTIHNFETCTLFMSTPWLALLFKFNAVSPHLPKQCLSVSIFPIGVYATRNWLLVLWMLFVINIYIYIYIMFPLGEVHYQGHSVWLVKYAGEW